MLKKPDCNNCDPKEPCHPSRAAIHPKGCKRYLPPKSTFKLVELALAYPSSINTLSKLPFKFEVMDYFKKGGNNA